MTTFSTDPALWIFTSLTAGSSHIVTATSRLETILRANRVPFKAVDIATDQKARMLWGRRAGKDEGGRLRKLPGLVQEGIVLGDLVEIEDWNEYGELKQHVKIYYDEHTIPNIHNKPPESKLRKKVNPAAKAGTAAAAAGAAKSATAAAGAGAGAAAAPPTPPPAPEPKAASSQPITKKKDSQAGGADKPGQPAAPMKSMADEAAQKAKELRLRTLREKVHGKKAATTDGASDAKSPAEGSKRHSSITGLKSDEGRAPGMQCPTTGAWRHSSQADAVRETLQSPLDSTWKQGAPATGPTGALAHRRLSVQAASEAAVKQVESALAIKEEPEKEDEMEEDKKKAEPAAEETDVAKPAETRAEEPEKPKSKKEESEEEEDEDDEDSDEEEEEDESEEDSEEESSKEKEAPKAKEKAKQEEDENA